MAGETYVSLHDLVCAVLGEKPEGFSEDNLLSATRAITHLQYPYGS